MIFISCSFDPSSMPYGQFVRSLFVQHGIDAYIAGHAAPMGLPEYLRTIVQQSEAVVALITDKDSPWQQTEITWAHDFKKPIFGIVQEGVEPRGILPFITVYQRFSPKKPETLNKAVQEIMTSIKKVRRTMKRMKKEQEELMGLGLFLLILWGLSQSKQ